MTPTEQQAQEYFEKLRAGYKQLTDGNLDADAFSDLSWLFTMARQFYCDYCKQNGIEPKSFDDIAAPKKAPGKIVQILEKLKP